MDDAKTEQPPADLPLPRPDPHAPKPPRKPKATAAEVGPSPTAKVIYPPKEDAPKAKKTKAVPVYPPKAE